MLERDHNDTTREYKQRVLEYKIAITQTRYCKSLAIDL